MWKGIVQTIKKYLSNTLHSSAILSKCMDYRDRSSNVILTNDVPSRGGLVVERWSDNRLDSATVGSNLCEVWFINRSEVEICGGKMMSKKKPMGHEKGWFSSI